MLELYIHSTNTSSHRGA